MAKVYKQKGQNFDVSVLHFIFCGSKFKSCLFLSLNIPKDPIIAEETFKLIIQFNTIHETLPSWLQLKAETQQSH